MKTLLHFLGGLWIALGCLHVVYSVVNKNGLLAVLSSPPPGTQGTIPFVLVLFLFMGERPDQGDRDLVRHPSQYR